jgi:hypothetical protein
MMKKLYQLDEGGRPSLYHEAWVDGDSVVEHFGRLGTQGEAKTHRPGWLSSAEKKLRQVLRAPIAKGFREVPIEDHAVLLIEYQIDGFGSPQDLDKRYALQDRMDEKLGWTGLGHCDGGSIGSGTMEVCCFVVDFATAKSVIEQDLQGTRFSHYTRIFEEGA